MEDVTEANSPKRKRESSLRQIQSKTRGMSIKS